MSDEDKNIEKIEMPGHSYDGITELDNPLPGWWLWTFFLTIIFSFIYYIHYQSGAGPSLKQELALAMREIEKVEGHQPGLLETEDTLADAMSNDEVLALGATTYSAKCVACHGNELQGLIGPNLADKYWIRGKGTRMDLVKIIREGVLDKGMPEWDKILKKEELYAVAAYILSKKGTMAPNPKAPQGEWVE